MSGRVQEVIGGKGMEVLDVLKNGVQGLRRFDNAQAAQHGMPGLDMSAPQNALHFQNLMRKQAQDADLASYIQLAQETRDKLSSPVSLAPPPYTPGPKEPASAPPGTFGPSDPQQLAMIIAALSGQGGD